MMEAKEMAPQRIELTAPHVYEQCQIRIDGSLPCAVSWPAWMSKEEYEDLEYWLSRVLVKAKRSIEPDGKRHIEVKRPAAIAAATGDTQ